MSKKKPTPIAPTSDRPTSPPSNPVTDDFFRAPQKCLLMLRLVIGAKGFAEFCERHPWIFIDKDLRLVLDELDDKL